MKFNSEWEPQRGNDSGYRAIPQPDQRDNFRAQDTINEPPQWEGD